LINPIPIDHLANRTNGQLRGESISYGAVSIDSRTLERGDLFVAIKGDNFDGHEYIEQAVKAGCCAVVVNESHRANGVNSAHLSEQSDVTSLSVQDTQLALGEAALINRELFAGPVIGLTGSSGKTSTKNMLAAILDQKGRACATEGNFNNEIGVPLTLLNLDSSHHYAVIEMGARSEGDIKYLTGIVKPDLAILLNAGLSHVDVFGSYENIVKAKGEIFESLSDDGIAVVNVDDPASDKWLSSISAQTIFSFSLSQNCADIFASEIKCDIESSSFNLNYKGKTQKISLPVPGEHNVHNSLAAASAAVCLGFELAVISEGLASLESSKGRLNTINLRNGITLVDDSYNANPASMRASLDVLNLRSGAKIAVLGEMGELGQRSKSLHVELAEYAVKTQINQFYLIGPFADAMQKIIGSRASCHSEKQEISTLISSELIGDETILVKGSRSTGMDDVVEYLTSRFK